MTFVGHGVFGIYFLRSVLLGSQSGLLTLARVRIADHYFVLAICLAGDLGRLEELARVANDLTGWQQQMLLIGCADGCNGRCLGGGGC